MKKLKKITLFLGILMLTLASCQKDQLVDFAEEKNVNEPNIELERLPDFTYEIKNMYYDCLDSSFHFPFPENIFHLYFGEDAERGGLTTENSTGGGTGDCSNGNSVGSAWVYANAAIHEWVFKPSETGASYAHTYEFEYIVTYTGGGIISNSVIIDDGCFWAIDHLEDC